MIEVSKLFKLLKKSGIDFFSGVPDSILKNTKNELEKKWSRQKKRDIRQKNQELPINSVMEKSDTRGCF